MESKRQASAELEEPALAGRTVERAEKIRTYNYPQNRVTDHRINISSYNLPAVMDGELDVFIDELAIRSETERLSAHGEDED